jgi:hypothetical protein
MLNKQKLRTPVVWIIVSIIFGCISETFGIMANKVTYLKHEGLFLIFDSISALFFVCALVFGVIAIVLFVKTRKIFTNYPFLKKQFFWTMASIILGCIGQVFDLMYYKVLSLENENLDILIGQSYTILVLLSVICGIISVVLIIKKRKIIHIVSGIAQVLLLLIVALILNSITLEANWNNGDSYRYLLTILF